jgi:hypothetical protein
MVSHPEDDLDWWYTLGRHMSFSSTVFLKVREIFFGSESEDPRSKKFEEYFESIGKGHYLT